MVTHRCHDRYSFASIKCFDGIGSKRIFGNS
jgi:hypothetical protein